MELTPNPLVLFPTPSEIVYVSPIYTVSCEGSQSTTRSRRTDRSSSDSSSRSSDGFIEEDFRAGGPSLSELPCDTIGMHYDHPFRKKHGDQFISELVRGVVHICWHHRLVLDDVGFYDRQSIYNESGTPVFTCMITAIKASPNDQWVEIARQVHEFLRQRRVSNIAVELVDPKLWQKAILLSCTPADPIYTLWPEIRGQIETTIPLRGVNIISCYRMGTEARNCTPTVVLGVSHSEERNWKAVREDIIKILTGHGLDMVGVLIRKDSIRLLQGVEDYFLGPGLDKIMPDGAAHIGQSLSPNLTPYSRGTLGGYVQVLNPTVGNWVTFGLTCCHCILPTGENLSPHQKEMVDKWKVSGVPMETPDAATILLVDSPSQDELTSRIGKLKEKIETFQKDEIYRRVAVAKEHDDFVNPPDDKNWKLTQKCIDMFSKERDDLKKYYHQKAYVLGTVFAASGLIERPLETITTREPAACPSVLDWALVRLKGRAVGTNKSSDLQSELPFGQLRYFSSSHEIEPQKSLMKLGHATGFTRGVYNGLRDSIISEKGITREHAILGSHTRAPFVASGDSGSLIFDELGTVHGMLFGGDDVGTHAYFTHITDLVADIKRALPGVVEIRLLEPED